MLVSDNTVEAECLGDFFRNLDKKGANVSKKMAKDVLKNPSRALDITANIATAAGNTSSKNVSSTLPEVIKFYHTGKGLYLGNFVCFLLFKWNKEQTDYTHLHH